MAIKNFFQFLIIISIFSCNREKDITLSDDICEACKQNMTHYFGNDSVVIPEIITPNGDGYNDFLMIFNLEEYENNSIQFFDRNMHQLAAYSPYSGGWPNVRLENGIYFYDLTIDTFEITGSVLLLSKKDDYYNIDIYDNTCGKECEWIDIFDPILLR